MWKINEVLSLNGQLYRILLINPGEIVWINIESSTAKPEYILELMLFNYLDQGCLTRHEDPYESLLLEAPPLGSVLFEKRERNLRIIEPVIVDEGCFDARIRSKRVKEVNDKSSASIATVYKLLRRYWQRGQNPNALIPMYKNSGAPGKSRSSTGAKKVGRERIFGDGKGMKVTPDIERLFRITIEKYLLSKKSLKTTVAYRQFAELFFQYFPKVKPADRPTLRQFRYFYDREYRQADRLIAQTEQSIFKKDIRPLSSTATAQVLGPGSRYEIDATIADIYLVDDNDKSKIIGRPTIYIVIDVFSRMITGFYVGYDSPSYTVAMQALVNACGDKTDRCRRYGIDISPDDWPCIGLPDVILADRGEMMSHQVDALISGFNIRVESAPPRRGDAKGIVESTFRTLQSEFKPYAPGVVEGLRVKKHGEKDYRTQAVMTMTDFVQIIVNTILFRNNHHVLDKYDRSEDLPADVPSIPIELWKWGIENRVGSLRQVDPELFYISLLPRKKVKISQFGVNLFGMYYSCSEILKEGWLHRNDNIERPQTLEAAYDPSHADRIYLFPKAGSRVYWECLLTDRSRQFRGMTFWQVWDIQGHEKHNKANAKNNEDAKRLELDKFIQRKISTAIKTAPKPSESDGERIRQIRTNKKDAISTERKSRSKAASVSVEKRKESSNVIHLTPAESDYRLPSFVPSLFDDSED